MKRILLNHEGKQFKLRARPFEEFHGITLACITLNESANIVDFINHAKPHVKKIVMIDGESSDNTVELALPLIDSLNVMQFTGHFGNQKNNALRLCSTDWVLFLDPDERLSEALIKQLPDLINQDEFDCYAFPRREFINGEEQKEVYPDYQDRLFRAYCRYVRPVHEELVGYHKKKFLPKGEPAEIIHIKSEVRHKERNGSYRYFQAHYNNEFGKPGTQTFATYDDLYDTTLKMLGEKE